MSMKISTSRILQALGGALQIANLVAPVVPADYKPLIAGIVAVLQWIVNDIAHKSTPDGSPVPATGEGGSQGASPVGKP